MHGRTDIIDNDKKIVWEIKCVQALKDEHFIQLALYKYMHMRNLKYVGYKYYLFNIRTGEVHKIDATLSIPSWKLPQLLIPNNNAPGVIKVSGNQTLGNEIINFIQQVNIEYFLAHELSKIIGDIPAHRVMQSNHLLHQWHQKNCKRITQSFFEFCTEEKNLFIKNHFYWSKKCNRYIDDKNCGISGGSGTDYLIELIDEI